MYLEYLLEYYSGKGAFMQLERFLVLKAHTALPVDPSLVVSRYPCEAPNTCHD